MGDNPSFASKPPNLTMRESLPSGSLNQSICRGMFMVLDWSCQKHVLWSFLSMMALIHNLSTVETEFSPSWWLIRAYFHPKSNLYLSRGVKTVSPWLTSYQKGKNPSTPMSDMSKGSYWSETGTTRAHQLEFLAYPSTSAIEGSLVAGKPLSPPSWPSSGCLPLKCFAAQRFFSWNCLFGVWPVWQCPSFRHFPACCLRWDEFQ